MLRRHRVTSLVALVLAVAAAAAAAAPPAYLQLTEGSLAGAISSSLPVLAANGPYIVTVTEQCLAAGLLCVPHQPHTFTYFFAEAKASRAQPWASLVPMVDNLRLLWHDRSLALFRIPVDPKYKTGVPLHALDVFDHSMIEVISLPVQPIRPPSDEARARLQTIAAKKLAFRQDVSDLVEQVTESSIQAYVRYLTGEDTASPLLSRNSYAEGGVVAGMWVESLFKAAGFGVQRPVFNPQFCPNVIGELRGAIEPDRVVVLGAHLDDRATDVSSPTQRAPGANDDGSGSSMLLEVARILAASNASFRYTIRIAAFCGEEQGLVGSRAYASELAGRNEDIVAMLQGDMIGYQAGANPELSFVSRYTDPDLTDIVANITATYVPTLRRSTTTACCSDHQSFFENGYPSAGFVEYGGYTIDPQYHRELDLSERSGYSFEQISLITQAMLASLAVLADLQ